MRLRILGACLIAMFTVSTAALGDIEEDGYWDGDTCGEGASAAGTWELSSVTAFADGDDNFCWAWAEGEHSVYTTVSATLNWSYRIYVYVEGLVEPAGGTGGDAYAYGLAQSDLPWEYPDKLEFAVDLETGEGDPVSDSDGDTRYVDGYDYFSDVNPVIRSEHSACSLGVVEYVETGEGSTAFSHVCARAYGRMWEQ